jgi:hypothetical protein
MFAAKGGQSAEQTQHTPGLIVLGMISFSLAWRD